MLFPLELGCEPGRCDDVLEMLARHGSQAALVNRVPCETLLPHNWQDEYEKLWGFLFAIFGSWSSLSKLFKGCMSLDDGKKRKGHRIY